MQRIQVYVTGSGQFPLDMLRYDGCFPAFESDAYIIERTFKEYGYWSINIAKVVNKPAKDWQKDWYCARWTSFNVQVVPKFALPSFENFEERKARLGKLAFASSGR